MADQPGPSEQLSTAVKKQVKKRRGKSSFTHRKSGTKGGRPRKSDESNCDVLDHTDKSPIPSPEVDHSVSVCLDNRSDEITAEGVVSQDELCSSETADAQNLFRSASPLRSESPSLVDKDNQNNQKAKDQHENPSTCPPDISVVCYVVEELRRRIFLPWVILPEEEGINVLLLSRDRARTTQRSVFFSFSGSEEVSVHCKKVTEPIVHDILDQSESQSNIVLNDSTKADFIDRIVCVIRKLRVYEVCVGVDDKQYKPLWEIDKNGEVDKNPYHEARYSETFRPFECEILVPTQKYFKRRCPVCIKNKIRFRNKLPHHSEQAAPPTTTNVNLDRNQLVAKVERQQKELKYARAQIVKLKAELEKALSRDGVDIGEELSGDLCSVVESADLDPVKELFFKEQIKLANKSHGRRWHPALIRLALLIKSTSTAAYRALQDSGMITLPSERTLYEYSHVVPPEQGCTKEKLNRVCKSLQNQYPEAYQKYHILLMDEMYVNQKLVYLKSTGELVGYVNLDEATEELKKLEAELKGEQVSSTPPVASKVLAYMVKGVATGVAELVASCPTSYDLDAGELYDRTWEVIGALERSGIRVIAIVSDGAAVNRSFYNLHTPPTKSATVIFDTVNLCAPSRPLYFLADVPHLLKTIRNCFYKSGSGSKFTRLLTKNGQVIVWKSIKDLYLGDSKQTLRRNSCNNSCNVFLTHIQ